MTLTRPPSSTGNADRQRFELELLLQQPIPGPDRLLQGRSILQTAIPEVTPEQWRLFPAVPINVDGDYLDIAIPSRWREREWHNLIEQLPEQSLTIRLHPALESDLLEALNPDLDNQPPPETVVAMLLAPQA